MRYLVHLPLSPACRKVRLVLAEKRLPFELRLEKVWEPRDDYLTLNPAGTVPTLLEDNGLAIPHSGVICEYLEEAYPDTPLLGTTLAERVEVRRLVAWFDEKFDAEVTRVVEGAAARVPGVVLVRAGSEEGNFRVILEFDPGTDLVTAANDVRDRVSRARGRLPDEVDEPIVAKEEADAQPVLWLTFTSDRFTRTELTDVVGTNLKKLYGLEFTFRRFKMLDSIDISNFRKQAKFSDAGNGFVFAAIDDVRGF
jgi:hypothetical protein